MQSKEPLFDWIESNDLAAIEQNLAKYEIQDWFSQNDLYDKNNSDGLNPIRFACKLDRSNILLFFYQFMSENIPPKNDDLELYTANKLCMAAYCGLLQEVENISLQYSLCDCATDGGRTPLYRAATNGHVEVVKFLHAHGADVNRANDEGITPLYVAAQNNHFDMVKFLVNNGANIDCARSEDGMTALHTAVVNNNLPIVEFLVTHDANINAINSGDFTPLLHAVFHGYVPIIKVLIERGADVNSTSDITPLSVAIHTKNPEVVSLLALHKDIAINQLLPALTSVIPLNEISKMSMLNLFSMLEEFMRKLSKYPAKWTALYIGCLNGLTDIVNILLQNPNIDVNLSAPLREAVRGKHVAIVRALLAKNADANLEDKDGNLPIIYAVANNSTEIAQMLLQKTNIDSMQAMSEILVTMAILNQNVDILQLLLDQKLDVNKNLTPLAVKRINQVSGKQIAITNPLSPLHMAVLLGYENLVRVFIESPLTKIDFPDSRNSTALIHAVCGGYFNIVKLLLDHNANIHHRTSEGATAFFWAAQEGHVAILELLLQHDAAIDAENNAGSTPLCTAVLKAQFATVKFLLEHGANVNQSKLGFTPLHLAIQINDIPIAKLLLENGADWKITNRRGANALEMAAIKSPAIAQFLKLWAIKEANKNAPLQQQILALLQTDNVNTHQTKTFLPFFSSTPQDPVSVLCQKLTNMNLSDEREFRQQLTNNSASIDSKVYSFIMEYILPKPSRKMDCDNSEVDSKRQKLL